MIRKNLDERFDSEGLVEYLNDNFKEAIAAQDYALSINNVNIYEMKNKK
jgi:hypothetical protein